MGKSKLWVDAEHRACSACKVIKHKEQFRPRRKGSDVRHSECAACTKARDKAYREKKPEKARARKLAWRTKNRARYEQHNKEYYQRTKARESARKLARRLADPEGYRQKCRERYRANRAGHRRAMEAWYAKNPGYKKRYHRKHYEENKAAYFLKSHKRRARLKAATVVEFTFEQLDQRMSVFGHCCAYCGGPFEHIDHVIPLSKGGLHALANLRPACATCNLTKNAKDAFEWLQSVKNRAA